MLVLTDFWFTRTHYLSYFFIFLALQQHYSSVIFEPVGPHSPESGPAAVEVEDLRRVEHLLEPPQEAVAAPVARLGVDEDDDGGAGQRHVHGPAVAPILEDLD